LALGVSADGAIWMGSTAGSLTRIDPNTLAGTQWKIPDVYRILADKQRGIWIATKGGLYLVNPQSAQRSPRLVEDPVITHPRDRFTDLSLDPNGCLWAAAEQGLFRLDGNGWHRIDPGRSGANPDLIAADLKGNLWAEGPSQDLMRLRVSGDRVVEAERIDRPPLMSEQVVSLMVDHRGWVWVGQDAGLTVYNGRGWRSFTQDDGLIWNDTDSYALTEDRDGSMWIGTSGGLSHLLEPQAAAAGPQPAPEYSQVMYGAEAHQNGAQVKWSKNSLVISMASLTFTDTRDMGIRYRLEGGRLGSGWEETHEMSARYRELGPGDYRFEAISVDAAGKALSPAAVFMFSITPQWWQNHVLQFGLALLVVMAVVLAWRRRIGQLMRQKRQLEEAVRLRTEDLEREKAELVRTREQMRHHAEHDDLTGLWNHRIIIERLRTEVDRSRRDGSPLSIILADLDHFKQINDTYGHPVGDLTLKEVSAIFQRSVRSYDWVGRYGGEEFLLILPGANLAGAQQRAEELRIAVQTARVAAGGTTIQLTASLGVVSGLPAHYEAMIQAADAAMYRAKNNGRNCTVATEISSPENSAASEGQTSH
jgi:diguanylate cyclase (GGDEF)-like protein